LLPGANAIKLIRQNSACNLTFNFGTPVTSTSPDAEKPVAQTFLSVSLRLHDLVSATPIHHVTTGTIGTAHPGKTLSGYPQRRKTNRRQPGTVCHLELQLPRIPKLLAAP
ncbi:MAG: hypothetical protein KDA69_10815, partial [Planctomycetaceae bacterium]|nr:hypothetical protein [Planctomycetaceae bacterium]